MKEHSQNLVPRHTQRLSLLSVIMRWYFTFSIVITIIHSTTLGPYSLPSSITTMSVGYDHTTNLIWLIGGSYGNNAQSLMSFNVSIWNKANAIINHGSNVLSHQVSVYGQSYVQKETTVYLVSADSELLSFDMSTQSLTTMNTSPSSLSLSYYGCLASIGDSIIYINEDKTYILTISTTSWKSSGNPIMSEERRHHSCIIEPNGGYLYVIGGYRLSNPFFHDSIEKLYVKDIKNIDQYGFTMLTNTLSYANLGSRAILYHTDIYVIGGFSSDDIEVIDTTTDSVSIWGKLHADIGHTSPIIIGNRVYIFGGDNGVAVDYWQYFDVFS